MPLRWAAEPMERGDFRVRHLLLAVAVFAAGVAIVERFIGLSWLVSLSLGALMWVVCSALLLAKHWRRRQR